MTCYLHIGTPKTGTTSIQKFITLNNNLLLQKQIIYPKIFCSNNQHAEIAYIVKNMKSDFKPWLNREMIFLKNEVSRNKNYTFLFSSEMISLYINEPCSLKYLQKLLKWLGFKNIVCILYLRSNEDYMISHSSQNIKCGLGIYYNKKAEFCTSMKMHIYKTICKNYINIFGKENLIVRLFDKNEFYQGDLLKDFVYSIGLEWDEKFQIPEKENETLDLIGFELQQRLNRLDCGWKNKINSTMKFSEKYFTSRDPHLKFQPPKEVVQSYIDYFEESNEWVRKEFFPHKERLFSKKDLSNYKENYELKEMKPEYWDKIAEFIADIVKTKTQTITNQTSHIQNLNNALVEITKEKDQCILNKDNLINNQADKIKFLQSNIQEKSTQLNQTQSKLSFQTKYGTAKSRIQNQLSYKLGQAMIVNSKSILGYLIMPMALLSIMISHKQEQKIYQEKIKKDPSLKLPPLEDYPDYQESLKLKNHLSYKLGQALIQANKTWYGGGISNCYLKLGS
ncbi:hypothetical protein L8X35_04835 [Campylobacter lari]|nr:hypothetical protein [Campylobacter lari]MCV3497943.1 hypothetical protein [Campylobacter lari]